MAGTHEPVAVLGMGAMGHGMAASALRAGIPAIVWDRRMEATRDLAELGAQVAESAADAEPVKLNETSGGCFYLTGLLRLVGFDGRAGLVDPHLGGQARG